MRSPVLNEFLFASEPAIPDKVPTTVLGAMAVAATTLLGLFSWIIKWLIQRDEKSCEINNANGLRIVEFGTKVAALEDRIEQQTKDHVRELSEVRRELAEVRRLVEDLRTPPGGPKK